MKSNNYRAVKTLNCYHPKVAFPSGFTKNGKTKYAVIEKKTVGKTYPPQAVTIPCGTCVACRLRKSKEWASRMVLESLCQEYPPIFMTLTYNDDHLPPKREGSPFHSLEISDLQRFFKRLRYRYPYDIKYYASGEYGALKGRPHYHIILFGLPIEALPISDYSYRSGDYIVYGSTEFDSKVWKNGQCLYSLANWDTMCYTARYVMKKQYGEGSAIYSHYNFVAPFSTMSLKRPIGKEFLDKHWLDIMNDKAIYLPDKGKQPIPSYFKNMLKSGEFGDDVAEDFDNYLVYSGVLADQKLQQIFQSTDSNFLDMLGDMEAVHNTAVTSLKRDLEL